MSIDKRRIGVMALAGLAIGLAIAGTSSYRELGEARAHALAAWGDIGQMQAERLRAARIALDQAGTPAPLADDVRDRLARAGALPPSPGMLDDPQAIDAYKRYQGELTGALFAMVMSRPAGQGSPALEALRSELPRQEAALAEARQRYGQAAARHHAIVSSFPGTAVALLTGEGSVPPAL